MMQMFCQPLPKVQLYPNCNVSKLLVMVGHVRAYLKVGKWELFCQKQMVKVVHKVKMHLVS